ncbi:MAG: IS21 family transposase [Firmicutes bacterium]|nr:IS21 family transposase [Bacillota bacterium]
MIDMAQFHRIKWLHEREGLSQRKIAQDLGIARNTVSRYIKGGSSPTAEQRRKSYSNRGFSDETQRVLPVIDEWLKQDESTWKKQRHTAARIYQRLVKEYGFTGSASNIRKVVARRRETQKEVFIPLEFALGHQFQFDWGEADVYLEGQLTRVYLFCVQLSASRRRFVRAYLYERQEAFFDGFVQAFTFLGGVPAEGLFDNLKSAVKKILTGRDRIEQETFEALQAHYLFQAEFCNVESGNEKGGVEHLVGYVRRNALVPLPDVRSLDELNQHLLAWCEESARTDFVPHVHERVIDVWAREQMTLHPLPPQPFEACRHKSAKVSKLSTIMFETNQYSVPCTHVGEVVWIKAFVDHVIIVAQNEVIATHARCHERDQMVLELDHYLDVLLRKPRAVRDARVMHTIDIPPIVRDFQREIRIRRGADGDRIFVRLLLLHREVGMDTIAKVIEMAIDKQIYHLEGLHALVMEQSGQAPPSGTLSRDKLPTDLALYRVQKADTMRYNALTQGGEER